MATGPQHYRDAEQLLGILDRGTEGDDAQVIATMAAAHATLALAAATALNDAISGVPLEDYDAWTAAASITATTEDGTQ